MEQFSPDIRGSILETAFGKEAPCCTRRPTVILLVQTVDTTVDSRFKSWTIALSNGMTEELSKADFHSDLGHSGRPFTGASLNPDRLMVDCQRM